VPEEQIPMEGLEISKDLTYEENPFKVLETVERITRSRTIRWCKVQWRHHTEAEATWEKEEDLMKQYPQLFS
jgi:hypothetical protein